MSDDFDPHEELVLKAARMVVVYRRVKPDDALEEHVKITALAVTVFEDMRPREAMRFAEDNWEAIENTSFAIDVLKDVDDLSLEDD